MNEELRKLFTEQRHAKLRQAQAFEDEAKALRQEAATLAKMAAVDKQPEKTLE